VAAGNKSLRPLEKGASMPEKTAIARAKKAKREGKSPSTQAGEFVREEIEHIRKGKHGAKSAKQAIAIGLSEARRAGVKLPPRPGKKEAKKSTHASKKSSFGQRAKAILEFLKKQPRSAASHRSLSRQARAAAKKRSPESRHEAAEKAVRTKGPDELRAAARKAARTRAERRAHSTQL